MNLHPRVDNNGQPYAPSEITRELIHGSPALFDDLLNYVTEVLIQLGEETVAQLPIGLRRMDRITYLDVKLNNAGVGGYFGDSTNDEDNSLIGYDETVEALRAMDGNDIADLMEEACVIWRAFLTEDERLLASSDPDSERRSLELFDKTYADLDPHYTRYDHLRLDFFKRVECYARTHEEEFLHSFNDDSSTPATHITQEDESSLSPHANRSVSRPKPSPLPSDD